MKEHRRQFIKKMVAGGVAATAFPHLVLGKESSTANYGIRATGQEPAPIRLALIGNGRMGADDVRSALRVPGVKLVAVSDLYEPRLQNAKREWGDDIFTTREYEAILSRNDVDAVIVGTSDHWHQQISIEAMKAGKHVYCEKPVIHKLSEAEDMLKAQQESRRVFVTGSQGMSSIGNRKAKQLVQSGAIGKVNFIEGAFTNPPRRPCSTPEGVTPADIWWDRYIMNSRRVSFAPERFFCWRHWMDYGTGIAGDLFVHVLSSLQYITGADGPEKIYTTGDTDGIGDTPYIMLTYFDYPDKNGIGAFKVALTANYADGVSRRWGSMDFNIVGSEGTLRVQWDRVTLRKATRVSAADFSGLAPIGNTIDRPEQVNDNELVFAERGYNNCHVDHFTSFFDGIRKGTPVDANVLFGVQTAVPAVLCYESFLTGKPIYWDPVNLKIKEG